VSLFLFALVWVLHSRGAIFSSLIVLLILYIATRQGVWRFFVIAIFALLALSWSIIIPDQLQEYIWLYLTRGEGMYGMIDMTGRRYIFDVGWQHILSSGLLAGRQVYINTKCLQWFCLCRTYSRAPRYVLLYYCLGNYQYLQYRSSSANKSHTKEYQGANITICGNHFVSHL